MLCFVAPNLRSGKVTLDIGLRHFTFPGPLAKKWPPKIFSWANALAEILWPSFGVCHPMILPASYYLSNVSAVLNCDEYEKTGPGWLGARSCLGMILLEKIGEVALREAGIAAIAKHPWGATVDLVEEPWAIEATELYEQQASVMNRLLSTGLVGDYTKWLKPKPGPNWIT